MRKRISILSVAAGALIATGALAQENVTTGVRASGPLDLISSQSANLQYRNYVQWKHEAADREEIETHVVTNQVRGNFTFNMFDDAVSNTLTLGAMAVNDGTQEIIQRRPRLYTEWSLVDTSYFFLRPYADIHGPQTTGHTRADLGMIPGVRTGNISTGIGDLALEFRIEAEGQYGSNKEDATVADNGIQDDGRGAGLTSTKDETTGETTYTIEDGKGPSYEVIYVPQVSLNMDRILKGFKVTSFVEFYNVFEEEIEVNSDNERKTRYKPTRDTLTYLQLTYAINDRLTFDDYIVRYDTGVYEHGGDSENSRYENLARLSYTLY